MSRKQYCDLIDKLCESLGVKDPKSKYDNCHLSLNQTAFTLAHEADAAEDLYIYADFGAPSPDRRMQALTHYLRSNFFFSGNSEPSFGCNPETGRFLLMLRIPLSHLSLKALMQVMAHISAQAREQRKTFDLALSN